MAYPRKHTIVSELFGSTMATAIVDLPTRLGYLVSMLPSIRNVTVDDIINKHTLLPVYTPFLTHDQLTRVRMDMEGETGTWIHLRIGSPRSTIPLPKTLQFCPTCVITDRDRIGETYWHRIHQVPGLKVCATHGVLLQTSSVLTRNTKTRNLFVTAESDIPQMVSEVKPLVHNDVLQHIAQDTLWLLNQSKLTPGLQTIHTRYLALLADRNLATYSRNVRVRCVIRAFTEQYPPDLLSLLHCEVNDHVKVNWLIRLVRMRDSVQHPIHHLLLMHFLGYTAERFFELPLEPKHFGDSPWPCLNPICNHYHKPCIETCHITHSPHVEGRPIATFACVCGYVYTRTGPDIDPEDRYDIGRVVTFGPVWEEALKTMWNDPSITLRAASVRLGVDIHTIKYHAARLGLSFPPAGSPRTQSVTIVPSQSLGVLELQRRDTYRSAWQDALKTSPSITATELRQQLPIVYIWLYRHDRIWLASHTPKRTTKLIGARPIQVNWIARDEQLAQDVQNAAIRLKEQEGRPQRVTKAALIREIGHSWQLKQNLNQLPRTQQALESSSETRKDWAVRRVWWTAEQYRYERTFPKRWQFVVRTQVLQIEDIPEARLAIDAALEMLRNKLDHQQSQTI